MDQEAFILHMNADILHMRPAYRSNVAGMKFRGIL